VPHLHQTPLASTLLRRRAFAQFQLSDLAAAAEGYEQAALISERVGDDANAVDAWIGQAMAAIHRAHYDQAGGFLALAQAKLVRLGGSAAAAARLRWLTASSNLASQQGQYADAAAQLRAALSDPTLPWTPLQEVASREQLANAEKEMGNDDAAAADYTRAIAVLERERKVPTPQLAGLYGEFGAIRHHQKQDGEARALYQRAIAMDDVLFGKDSLDSASWFNNLAVLESDAGNLELALGLLDRVLGIKERVHGPDHPSVAVSLINQSTVDILLGHPRTAEERLRRAAKILTTSKGADHPDLVAVYTNLGAALREQGQLQQADDSFGRALRIAQLRLRRDHPWLSSLLSERGTNDLRRRRWRAAKADFERALEVDAANKAPPDERAASRFGLARALMKLGEDPSRARSLAQAALAAAEAGHLSSLGPSAEEIRRWLRAHRQIAPAR
jgi:tetratricopeptide (TPR) repeat protein